MARCPMARWLTAGVLGIAALLVAACDGGAGAASSGSEAKGGEPLRVVCTIGMVTDVAGAVAGDRAEVVGLMGPGIDPHLYKATRSDVQRLLDADIIFCNGLHLEGRMSDVLLRSASADRPVHAVAAELDESVLLEPDELEGLFDPHVWMDPRAWSGVVDVVRDALIDADPEGAAGYETRAATYRAELEALDAYATRVLASVPEDRRVLVTAHDAFNYFGARYGYEVVGILGISTESEAGIRKIERLVDLIVERRIPAVFVESTVSQANVEARGAGARQRGHDVRIGGELFSDAMGAAGTYEGTYIGMIDHNVTTIARALGGEAPESGMRGALTRR